MHPSAPAAVARREDERRAAVHAVMARLEERRAGLHKPMPILSGGEHGIQLFEITTAELAEVVFPRILEETDEVRLVVGVVFPTPTKNAYEDLIRPSFPTERRHTWMEKPSSRRRRASTGEVAMAPLVAGVAATNLGGV